MVLIVDIIRFLIIVMIVRVITGYFSTRRRTAGARVPRPAPERVGGTLVRDPHCGTYVAESRAVTMGTGASALHFCSAACRDAWSAAHGRASGLKA